MSARNRNIAAINRARQKEKGTRRPESQNEKLTKEQNREQTALVIYSEIRFYTQFLCVLLFGTLHSFHVGVLFENDRHFSHLSALEREMTFRTEMGLYYSYFKHIVEAPSFGSGLWKVMNDNLTEYPTSINALQRFNVYPEVVLGGLFRLCTEAGRLFDIKLKECWMVDRGNLAPVESCDGYGDPAVFYVRGVWIWSSITVGVIMLYGKLLSGSLLGSLFAVVGFFYNHSECTRVQWTPPLRESFAYPMCVAQMYAVSRMLRYPERVMSNFVLVSLLTVLYLLPWQFAQFTLFTQTFAIMCLFSLRLIPKDQCVLILFAQLVGMTISWIFLMGNKMLVMSVFNTCLVSSIIVVLLSNYFEGIKSRVLFAFTQMSILVTLMVAIRLILPRISDDDHVWDLLLSKFTSFRDFHTLLYTCAPEFDFLDGKSVQKLIESLLLPVTALICVIVAVQILIELLRTGEEEEHIIKPDSAVLAYNLLQLGAFSVMAVLIMRLKLFFTPHLCILSSLAFSDRLVKVCKWREAYTGYLLSVLMIMSYRGLYNLDAQWEVRGEYNNPQLEQLIEWVNTNTHQNAVFAGTMPTMANLMLSTRRPVVNHPHYEDSGARDRNKRVYSLFSRKPVSEVHTILKDMGVQYAVVEESYCYRTRKESCSMTDIWDVEDEVNRDRTATCEILYSNSSPLFKQMFRNSVYAVYKVIK